MLRLCFGSATGVENVSIHSTACHSFKLHNAHILGPLGTQPRSGRTCSAARFVFDTTATVRSPLRWEGTERNGILSLDAPGPWLLSGPLVACARDVWETTVEGVTVPPRRHTTDRCGLGDGLTGAGKL